MHKTKLGISVGILGSIICILGAVAGLQWYFIGIVAYILLQEQNEWLRRLSLKVTIILLGLSVFNLVVPYFFGALYDLIDVFSDRYVAWPLDASSYITKYASIIVDVVLVLMGLKAIKQGHFSVKAVDELISKNV